MGQPIDTAGDAGPEFAAGVATATAAQAAEDAAEAESAAEVALIVAEGAAETAGAAEAAAWDARTAIDDLRFEMNSRFDELAARTVVAEAVALEAAEAIEDEGGSPGDEITPPEQHDSTGKPAPTEEEPKGSSGAPKPKKSHTGYGASWIQPRS